MKYGVVFYVPAERDVFTILTFMPAVISKYPAVVDVFGNVRSVSPGQ